MATTILPKAQAGAKPETTRESLQAKRPVAGTGWFDDLTLRAWELRGSTLDFYEPADLALTIVGSGEVYRTLKRSEKLGDVSLKAAAKRARREVPDTFKQPMILRTESLGIRREATPSMVEYVAILNVASTPELEGEFDGITQGIDLTSGRWHPWRGLGTPVIKLATIAHGEHIGQDFLDELSLSVPAEIYAEPGFIRKVQLDDTTM